MGDIDLTNPDSRKNYLKENLGHLMEGIDSNYGQVLMDELMRRMEATVSEFNEEVKAMLGQLQGKKPAPRDNIMASAPPPAPEPQQSPPAPAQAPPPTPKAAPAPPPKAAPAPPSTDLKPPPVEQPAAPELPDLDAAPAEPEPFIEPEPAESKQKIKEVEIEVDLPEDQLSDFEKKLKSLTQ